MDKIIDKIKRLPQTLETSRDLLDLISQAPRDKIPTKAQREPLLEDIIFVRKYLRSHTSAMSYKLLKKSYLIAAKLGSFDDFLIYNEWDRPIEKQFYLPRRKVMHTLVNDLQDLFDDELDFLGVSLPPRVGKSTLCIFFMSFCMGFRPEVAHVMSGFSDKLTDGFYGEILNIISDVETYNWHDVFPNVQLVNKSAKDETIDLLKVKRFPSITCRSIGGTLTGAVEIGEKGILYCDDLIEDLEEALNMDRLDNKYDAYLNQLKDRKKMGAKELMVGTRWNVFDPLGRIQAQYENNPRYRFRVIPALNENDESNFVYDYGVGFDTEYYHDMRNSIDKATWWAKYMGKPYVREGLLFPEDELKFYNGTLPPGEPDVIRAVCDVAFGGGDSLSHPVAYVYGEDVYIHDWVFSDLDKTKTQPMLVACIVNNNVQRDKFEANNGGDFYCEEVSAMLKEENYHCSITSEKAPNKQSKLGRIIQMAPDIRNFYFLDNEHQSQQYRSAMREVVTFTQDGKNKHDDASDSLSMLAKEIYGKSKKIQVYKRLF